jgi:hypothetical protein
MKKVLILIMLTFLIMLTSCTRNDVSDPQLFGPSTYDIILEGAASPSSLYIPETRNVQTSLLTVKVTRYDGKPVVGKEVIFQQVRKLSTGNDYISWGYFDDVNFSMKKTTDANGSVSVRYSIPGAYPNIPDFSLTIYVFATLIDDSRQVFDSGTIGVIRDEIPVNIYVNN